ncbi:hypothetical protein CDL15_Pgr005271 [Punica granatum]|uniref:Uncharacterized protein n=1 Tax=Punica granatum TaxID=22663 RepID=A0A218WW80_PUNGR|nr:hypothetical protein CDL15_Pgr005271 [Punica granatum]
MRCMKGNSLGLADLARFQGHERGGSANLRCRKVSSRGLADQARWPEAWARKVSSHGLADPARLQGSRARWLCELAVQESKLARVRRPGKTWQGCKRHERGGSANLRCKSVNSDGLADLARLPEARARWLGELAVQESKLARSQQGCKRHERGGSANLQCKKVNSHGLEGPTRLQEARTRLPGARRTCGERKKVGSHGLPDPARLQGALARWLGELLIQESKLARTRLGCRRHERGGSANLRCKKVNSHGLADPSRLQEARARLPGVRTRI